MKIILLVAFLFPFSVIAQSKAINDARFVVIGGIEQWVTIKGADSTKPVILFLHGGPGSVMSPYNDAINQEWQKDSGNA